MVRLVEVVNQVKGFQRNMIGVKVYFLLRIRFLTVVQQIRYCEVALVDLLEGVVNGDLHKIVLSTTI